LRTFLGAGLGTLLPACDLFARKPPHLVLLVADSLRAASLPIYGYRRNTAPFLSALAERSTVFDRCYSAATWTRPAVTSILSGLTPLEHRQVSFEKSFPPDLPSLPLALGSLGYTAGFFSANHAVGDGYGMEEHFDHVSCEAAIADYAGPRVTEECASWLSSVPAGPIFAYVHYFPPHGPYEPPAEHLEALAPAPPHPAARVPISLGNTSLGRIPWYQAIAGFSDDPAVYSDRYDANVRFADALLSGFFAIWKRIFPGQRTIFVVTGDHGEDLEEHGHWFDHARILSDKILHVPLLWHDTNRSTGRRVPHPVSHLDLGTTLIRMARGSGSLGPHGLDLFGDGFSRRGRGRSVVSQVDGPNQHHDAGWALTRGDWRLVYNDAPLDGAAEILDVQLERPSGSRPRAAVPRRLGSMPRPTTLVPGVRLEELDLLSDPPHPGESCAIAGRVHFGSSRARSGALRLWLRAGRAGQSRYLLHPDARGELAGSVEVPGTVPGGGSDDFVEVLGRWEEDRGSVSPDREEGPWLPLSSFPLLSATELRPGIQLLGVDPEAPALCPGDSVRVTCWWRLEVAPSKSTALYTHLIDGAGRTVARDERLFFAPLPAPGMPVNLVPLIEDWRLKGRAFRGHRLDLVEHRWLTVPPDLPEGRYELRVGLFDYEEDAERTPPEALRGSGRSEAADLGVYSDPCGAFLATQTLSRDLRRHDQLWRRELQDPPEGECRSGLASLARSYPDERHLSSLLERSSEGDEAAQDPPAGAAAHHRCDVRFATVARLLGFDLRRAPDDGEDLQLTLYWRSLGRPSTVYSGELYVRGTTPRKEERSSSSWWFLGGAQRSSRDWRVGEVFSETVRVPRLGPEVEEVSLWLSLTERWELVYSNGRQRVQVPTYVTDRPVPGGAALGTFAVAELPEAQTCSSAMKRSDRRQYRLYDLSRDPGERNDLTERKKEIFEDMRRDLQARMTTTTATDFDAPDAQIPDEVLEGLRSLGYNA
jgi:arylsulfatase A-like enzyme